ncbi:MAG: ABC transporter permease [Dehalococcoidia bacterium]
MLVFSLTMRQLLGRTRLTWIVLLAAAPAVLAAWMNLADTGLTVTDMTNIIMSNLVISAVLPVVIVLLAIAAFGNELEDRTLSYLMLKPVPRWKIAVPKLLATVIAGGGLVALSGGIAAYFASDGDVSRALVAALGLFLGASAYAAAFTWLGLLTTQGLAFGLLYAFIWEASLANFLSGIKFLSIRQYTMGVMHGLEPSFFDDRVNGLLSLQAGLIGIAVVFALFLALTIRRLRTMDVP